LKSEQGTIILIIEQSFESGQSAVQDNQLTSDELISEKLENFTFFVVENFGATTQ
jgi:hypothetical protein